MYVSNTKAQLNTQDTEAKYTKKCAYTHVVRSVMQNNGTLSGTKPTPSSTRVWVRFYTVLVVFTEREKGEKCIRV